MTVIAVNLKVSCSCAYEREALCSICVDLLSVMSQIQMQHCSVLLHLEHVFYLCGPPPVSTCGVAVQM